MRYASQCYSMPECWFLSYKRKLWFPYIADVREYNFPLSAIYCVMNCAFGWLALKSIFNFGGGDVR